MFVAYTTLFLLRLNIVEYYANVNRQHFYVYADKVHLWIIISNNQKYNLCNQWYIIILKIFNNFDSCVGYMGHPDAWLVDHTSLSGKVNL